MDLWIGFKIVFFIVKDQYAASLARVVKTFLTYAIDFSSGATSMASVGFIAALLHL